VAEGGGGSNFLGPVDLALGHCAASFGLYDVACAELEAAVAMCRTVGAPGFGVEADTELAEFHARTGAHKLRQSSPVAHYRWHAPRHDALGRSARDLCRV
jgi:hypothetical protein